MADLPDTIVYVHHDWKFLSLIAIFGHLLSQTLRLHQFYKLFLACIYHSIYQYNLYIYIYILYICFKRVRPKNLPRQTSAKCQVFLHSFHWFRSHGHRVCGDVGQVADFPSPNLCHVSPRSNSWCKISPQVAVLIQFYQKRLKKGQNTSWKGESRTHNIVNLDWMGSGGSNNWMTHWTYNKCKSSKHKEINYSQTGVLNVSLSSALDIQSLP